ncbi:hypothetical protein P691DRAFT_786507 [Macrolepiota fuliginosa MF-IS2]|uniref:Uncharacterized protein n=1 Tax=Macrolepiota fuliginosa MF-IS2 TaxID=1400762 RepID=A0A9P5X4X9_9AGAR|nr:hypothetical protein P691DRAFT_786507 [Macrolepiota fuliginosa MF-IS2]
MDYAMRGVNEVTWNDCRILFSHSYRHEPVPQWLGDGSDTPMYNILTKLVLSRMRWTGVKHAHKSATCQDFPSLLEVLIVIKEFQVRPLEIVTIGGEQLITALRRSHHTGVGRIPNQEAKLGHNFYKSPSQCLDHRVHLTRYNQASLNIITRGGGNWDEQKTKTYRTDPILVVRNRWTSMNSVQHS